jgi:HK97 gp10 family phage protein
MAVIRRDEIAGMDEALRNLKSLGDLADEMEDSVLKSAGEYVVGKARSILSGRGLNAATSLLFRSIKASPIRWGKHGKSIWVGDVDRRSGPAVGMKKGASKRARRPGKKARDGDVAWFYEYGTANQDAQPFMRPAVFDNIKGIVSIMESEVRKILGRFGGLDP